MAVDVIARALSATAIDMIQNQGGRYIGDTPLTAGQEQGQLNEFVKNQTGGNPISGDEVADTNTGNIWRFDGNTWKITSFNPDHAQVLQNKNDIANLRIRVTKNEQDITQLNADLNQEKIDRKNKDDDLQDQIDALQALAKGVKEVVGSYADMQLIDKTTLVDGDIINILADETHDGVNAYYRFDHAAQDYVYIGSISPYYTKTQIDTKEQALKDLIDKKQDKLVAVDNSIELTPDPNTGNVFIRAKLDGALSDTPIEDDDKIFSNGGAYKLAPTLNGRKVIENPTFFAPETLGTEGQIISVDANGNLVWVDNEAGGGDIKKITINGVEQPLDPIDKIASIDTDDTLIETPQTNLLSVAKANIPITKADYEALTQVEREDESKVYLITDDVTDAPVIISEIDDTPDTKGAENLTRSNKYITENIEEILHNWSEWHIDSKITLNGIENIMMNKLNMTFYAPETAGQEGEAVIMGADGKPTWGSASKVTLNGTETKDAAFYAPVTAGTTGQAVLMGDDGIPTWGDVDTKVTLNGTVTKNPSFYAAPTSTAADAGLMLRSNGANSAPVWGHPRLAVLTGQYSSFSVAAGSSVSASMSSTYAYNNFTIGGKAVFTPGSNLINVNGVYLFTFTGTQVRSNTSGWTTYYYRIVPTDGSTVTIGQIYQSDFSGTRSCVACQALVSVYRPSYLYLYIVSTADHATTHTGYGKVVYLGATS